MSNVRGKIFCQRCKSPNELGEDSCGQCGTRLMLLVEPSGARFESRGTGGVMEEHLLERVTAIETHISRVIDKLEKMAELMLKQSRSAYFDHELLDTLITVLGESGAISRQRLAELWRERRKKEPGEQGAEGAAEEGGPPRFDAMVRVVLRDYGGDVRDEFERLVREGFGEVEKGRAAAGLRKLERAAALAPGNASLNHFLGMQLYREGRTAPARDYFERALASDPESAWLQLLTGLACGDEGEVGRARELLKASLFKNVSTFAAHYALGRLAASESDWKGALAEFRLAHATRPCPEGHYLLGLADYQLGRDKAALRELRKAVGLDAAYAQAHYLLGVVLLRAGVREGAREAFGAAAAARPDVQLYRDAAENPDAAAAPSLFEAKGRGRRRRLITGGDERLAQALFADALGKAKAL